MVTTGSLHTIISYLYYIPIFMVCLVFPIAGAIFAIVIGLIYLIGEYTTDYSFTLDNLLRSLLFILTGAIISFIILYNKGIDEKQLKLIDKSGSGIIKLYLKSGKILYSNNYINHLLSPNSETLTGISLYNYSTAKEELIEYIKTSNKSTRKQIQHLFISDDGNCHLLLVTAVRESANQYILFLTENIDIQKSKAKSNTANEKFFNAIPDGIWIAKKDGTVIRMNKACKNISLPINASNSKIFSIFDDPWEEIIKTSFGSVITSEKDTQFNILFDHLNKEYVVKLLPVISDKNELIHIIGIMHEITDQITLIRKINDQETFLRTILEGLPMAALVIDTNHRVLYINQALSILFEREVDYIIGTHDHSSLLDSKDKPLLADIMVEDDVDIALETYYEGKYVSSSTLPGAFEVIDFQKDVGENGKWIRTTAARLVDKLGNTIGAIETFEDYSSTKDATDKVRIKTEVFKMASSLASDLIFEYDIIDKQIEWFGDLNERLGYPSGYLDSNIYNWLSLIHEDDYEEFLKAFRHHISSGDPLEMEIQIRHKDNVYRNWIVKAAASYDVNMQHTKTVGVITDVTEIKGIEEAKRTAIETIEHNIQQFSILGDYIRNPLQAISGYNDLQGGEMYDKISFQIQRIDEIVDRLDKGWIESESIRDFLRRHYQINAPKDKNIIRSDDDKKIRGY